MARLQKIVIATLSLAFIFGLIATQIVASTGQTPVQDGPPRIDPPFADLRTSDLRDSFDEQHFGHRHEAIDIMEPLGTPIRAVDDGRIRKLFLSRAGGTTIYQFNDSGSYCYYYAHLDHYVDDLREGQRVFRGQIIGYVGTSGDASPNAPQLHFAIFRLDDDKRWWKGTPINPYPILLEAVKRIPPTDNAGIATN
jgi:murein DD-endopeptidase MepM/ murein hydrolase activator NlpD